MTQYPKCNEAMNFQIQFRTDRQTQANSDRLKQTQTNSNKFRQTQTNSDKLKLKQIQTNSSKFRQTQANSDKPRHAQTSLGKLKQKLNLRSNVSLD